MISVVTPSLNQGDWLRLAVASVADQEGVDYEHIVQDAGTPGLARMLEANFPHDLASEKLQLFIEPDGGMYDAVNRGLSRTKGDLCAYLNCDEQYLPGALAKVEEFFARHPDADVLFGDMILVDRQGEPLSYRRVVLPVRTHLRFAHLNTGSCATFFRRRILDRGLYFPSEWKALGDLVWVDSLLQADAQLRTLALPLATFTFTGENLGASPLSISEARRWKGAPRFAGVRTALSVVRHRFRKALRGAYRRRNVEIDLYTIESPNKRQRRAAKNVGFRWNPA
ncbi:hypothetical protein BH20VER3_BH20VER3_02650 [soil metagenome]